MATLEAAAVHATQHTQESIHREAAKAQSLAEQLAQAPHPSSLLPPSCSCRQAQRAATDAEATAAAVRTALAATEAERDAAQNALAALETRSQEAAAALETSHGKRQAEEAARAGLEDAVQVLESKLARMESCLLYTSPSPRDS